VQGAKVPPSRRHWKDGASSSSSVENAKVWRRVSLSTKLFSPGPASRLTVGARVSRKWATTVHGPNSLLGSHSGSAPPVQTVSVVSNVQLAVAPAHVPPDQWLKDHPGLAAALTVTRHWFPRPLGSTVQLPWRPAAMAAHSKRRFAGFDAGETHGSAGGRGLNALARMVPCPKTARVSESLPAAAAVEGITHSSASAARSTPARRTARASGAWGVGGRAVIFCRAHLRAGRLTVPEAAPGRHAPEG
jgi:hypothetical protein